MKAALGAPDAKKNVFFSVTCWTDRFSLVIFYALFAAVEFSCVSSAEAQDSSAGPARQSQGAVREDELDVARSEFGLLRRELSEVLSNSEKLNGRYLRLKLGVASAVGGSEPELDAETCLLAVDAYRSLCRSARELTSKIVALDVFVRELIEKDRIEDLDKVRLKCRLDDLRGEAEKFNMLAKPPGEVKMPDSCRILAVSDKLQAAVLDVGTANSVSCGLLCRAVNGKTGKAVVMKIVALRPFISAAVAVEGEMGGLAPGMKVTLGNQN